MTARIQVASFWHGSSLSPIADTSIRSFIHYGHSYVLYTYNRTLETPPGCTVRDANVVLPEEDIIFYKSGPGKGSIALFANLFRYKLLEDRPGWWVDTDVICLSEKFPVQEYIFGFQDYDETIINNAILKIPPNSPLPKYCKDEARKAGENAFWGQTGPRLLTEAIRKFGLEAHALPRTLLYPIPWTNALDLIKPEAADQLNEDIQESYLIHLWNEIFRRNQLADISNPPAGSVLQQMFEKYGSAR